MSIIDNFLDNSVLKKQEDLVGNDLYGMWDPLGKLTLDLNEDVEHARRKIGAGGAAAQDTPGATLMPSLTDSDRRAAARRARARLMARGGRASTILTDGDALGGGL